MMTLRAKYGSKKIDGILGMAKKSAVLVGVLRGTGGHPHSKAGHTIALIAAWNEFGNRRIPSRPFLRTTLREHEYYKQELKKALLTAITTKGEADSLLKLVGIKAASDIRNKITNNDFRRNAPATIRRKSTSSGVKDKPLIDSGALRQSIQSQLEKF